MLIRIVTDLFCKTPHLRSENNNQYMTIKFLVEMKKDFIIVGAALVSLAAQAQVGINTENPKTTLDVVNSAKNTAAEGVMMPRLTGDELKDRDAAYSADQTSAMVYVTAPITSPSAKTRNVTAKGYYYFDGSIWQTAKGGGSTITASNGLTLSNDDVQLGGTLTKDTEIVQNGKNLFTTGNGKVSIGAVPTANSAKFEVDGASTNTRSYSANGMNIDFTKSNLAYTTASAGAFTVTGLKDGGTYTLAVKGRNSGTASFSQAGILFHFVNNGATTADKHTLYTFVVIGSDAYVWMTKGFQFN